MKIPANDSVHYYGLASSNSSIFVRINGPASVHVDHEVAKASLSNEERLDRALANIKYPIVTSYLALNSIILIIAATVGAFVFAAKGNIVAYLTFTTFVLIGLAALWISIRQAKAVVSKELRR